MKTCPKCNRCYDDAAAACGEPAHGPPKKGRPGPPVIANKYRLERLLGVGAMGAVYQSTLLGTDKVRAVKLLNPEYINKDPQAAERFRNEFQTGDLVGHRNIVRVYDYFDLGNDGACIVMEFIEGESLRAYLNRRGAVPIPLDEAVMIASQLAQGIGALHLKHILHRDLKPENVMLTKDEHGQPLVKVVDFGLAKPLKSLGLPQHKSRIFVKEFVGTMLYTSPENCRGEDVSERSDIYSLGIVLYEMLAGRPPFTGRSTEVERQHRLDAPVSISTRRADLPPALAELVMRALEKDPKARPQTAKEFADRLHWIKVGIKGDAAQPAPAPTPDLPSAGSTKEQPGPTVRKSGAKNTQPFKAQEGRAAEQPHESSINITIMKPLRDEKRNTPLVRSRHEVDFPSRNSKTGGPLIALAVVVVLVLVGGGVFYKYATGRYQHYVELGLAHMEKDENDQAVEALSSAINLDPNQFMPYYYRALARHKQRDTEAAIKDYSEVIRLAPEFIPAYQSRAGIYTARGEHARAIEDYTHMLRLVPDASTYQLRGDANFKNKDYDHAITDYTEAIHLDPNNPNVFESRGVAYNKRGMTGDRSLADADRLRAAQLRK